MGIQWYLQIKSCRSDIKQKLRVHCVIIFFFTIRLQPDFKIQNVYLLLMMIDVCVLLYIVE